MRVLPVVTLAQIRSWHPCYDPAKYAPEDWQGTALDILKHPEIPPADKIWCVARKECLDDRTLRLFACWCAEQALALIQPELVDPRSTAAIDVARRYALGHATKEELDAAWSAARFAARSAADAAADAAESAQVQYLIELIEAQIAGGDQ